MKSELQYHLLLHLIVVVFGFTAILGEEITVPSTHIVWYRMGIAFLGLMVWAVITKYSLNEKGTDILKFMGAGVIVAAHWILFFEAIELSNISITLAALSATTFFVAFFEPLLYRRKISWMEVFFGICVMGGLLLILNIEEGAFIGIAMGVGSAMLAALFGTLNGLLVRKNRPASITFYEMIGGFIAASIYLMFDKAFEPAFFQLTGYNWLLLLLLALVATSFAFVVSVRVMKKLSPFTVSMAINLEPVYGVLLALVFYPEKETMSSGFYVGALIILSTIFANTLWKRYEKRKQRAAATQDV